MRLTSSSIFRSKKRRAVVVGLVGGATLCATVAFFSSSLVGAAATIFATALAFFAVDATIGDVVRDRKKIVRFAVATTTFLVGTVLIAATSIRAIAPLFLFYPHSDEASRRELSRRDDAQELSLTVDGKRISGWLLLDRKNTKNDVSKKDEPTPILIYFPGNGENAARRTLELLDDPDERAPFAGFNVAIFDYPGYGKSDGTPSERSLKEYGLAVYDAARRSFADANAPTNDARTNETSPRIVLFGYSIGTGVANYVASQRNVSGLILAAPYASGFDLYNERVPIFFGPGKALVDFPMNAEEFAKTIEVAPLIFASPDDRIVSYRGSRRLANAYPRGADFRTIEGIGHNDFWQTPEVRAEIKRYLRRFRQN